ncbi:type II toxin-antitoxin system RelE family toxin [Dyadobacter sp. OTU695]|uniref:type II toxin-antitoxin system RelE family toxin n=1 Tax=Dyadobacter sp. OTU695 TaxID=3043860 RepID=UPI00313EB188
MKYEYTNAFIKDVKKSSPEIQSQVRDLVEEIRKVDRLVELPNVKKMKGFSNAFRIRLGEYRVDIFLENGTMILARMLHRKEVYRYFP